MLKKLAVIGIAILMPVAAMAAPYFRAIGSNNYQQSVGTLYGIGTPTSIVTDIALVTHSTADGTIIPAWMQSLGVAPEDWVPLQIGGGGSLKGTGVVNFGMSINVCPQVLGWMVSGISETSSPMLLLLKEAIVGDGATIPKLRVGWDEQGTAVSGGVFQSLPEAFPGHGVLDIMGRAGRVEVGVAWKY